MSIEMDKLVYCFFRERVGKELLLEREREPKRVRDLFLFFIGFLIQLLVGLIVFYHLIFTFLAIVMGIC